MSADILVWWRDDDAGHHDTRLDRLLALAAADDRPLALAVVPAWLEAGAAAIILRTPTAYVMQHGWGHADHAPAGAKPIELGGVIDDAACCDALGRGLSILKAAFGERFLPVMVPPWNRIEARSLKVLAELGFRGLSTFGDDARGTDYGIVHVNTHVDLIDWRGSRRMKPMTQLISEIDHHLASPDCCSLGFLTHHLKMTLDEITLLRQLFIHVDQLGRCRWADLPSLFAPG